MRAFLNEKLFRHGFSVVERMVATAIKSAETETFQRLETIIDEILPQDLDGLLQSPQPSHLTSLAWLRQSAASDLPKLILGDLQKLKNCKGGKRRMAGVSLFLRIKAAREPA